MQRILRRLSSLVFLNRVSTSTSKLEPQEVGLSLGQRKKFVESIDRSLKPDLHHFPTNLTEAGLELQLETLKSSWIQLYLTYGFKEDTLQEFVKHCAQEAAAQFPHCKLVSVVRLFEGDTEGGHFINRHMLRFAAERGYNLDPEVEPDEYPELHQLIVEFGREVCEKYPLIFRDLYLLYVRDIQPFVEEMYARQNYRAQFIRKGSDPSRSLFQWLEDSKNLDHWYCFTHQMDSELRECDFHFIRSLKRTPFDPIAQSNVVDPVVRLKAWERAGLLAAAPARVHLTVKEIPVPPPFAPSDRN